MRPEPWNGDAGGVEALRLSIDAAQGRIDRIVAQLYGVKPGKETREEARRNQAAKEETARRWVSYALGIWLGRWEQPAAGEIAALAAIG